MSTNLSVPYTDYENYLILAMKFNVWCLKNVKLREDDTNLTRKYEEVLEAVKLKYLGRTSKFTNLDTKNCMKIFLDEEQIEQNLALQCEKSKLFQRPSGNLKIIILLVSAPLLWIVVYLSFTFANKRPTAVAPIT